MRVGVYAGAVLIALSGVLVAAQNKVTTPEEFDKAMKPAGPAMRNMGKALQSGAAADVKKELAVVKTALADTQSFWVLHKKDDAVKMNKESIAKVEALEKLVDGDKVAPEAAAEVIRAAANARNLSLIHVPIERVRLSHRDSWIWTKG